MNNCCSRTVDQISGVYLNLFLNSRLNIVLESRIASCCLNAMHKRIEKGSSYEYSVRRKWPRHRPAISQV